MDRTGDWWQQAAGELAAAQTLLAAGHWAWACFTGQQAAEKALKATLEHFRAGRTGHNLNELCQALEAHTPVPQNVREACARLDRHYIPTRSPDAFASGAPVDQFLEVDARQALADAEAVMAHVGLLVGSA